jgi:hypothetical protein
MYQVIIADVVVEVVSSRQEALLVLRDYGIGGSELDSESVDYEIREVKGK